MQKAWNKKRSRGIHAARSIIPVRLRLQGGQDKMSRVMVLYQCLMCNRRMTTKQPICPNCDEPLEYD